MAQLVRILDERKWALRCFYADLVAILLVLVLAVALAVDSFHAGYRTWYALQDPSHLFVRDAIMYRMIFEALGLGLSFAWIIYRLVRHGYRSVAAKP